MTCVLCTTPTGCECEPPSEAPALCLRCAEGCLAQPARLGTTAHVHGTVRHRRQFSRQLVILALADTSLSPNTPFPAPATSTGGEGANPEPAFRTASLFCRGPFLDRAAVEFIARDVLPGDGVAADGVFTVGTRGIHLAATAFHKTACPALSPPSPDDCSLVGSL
eukprot:EG_transcript_35172